MPSLASVSGGITDEHCSQILPAKIQIFCHIMQKSHVRTAAVVEQSSINHAPASSQNTSTEHQRLAETQDALKLAIEQMQEFAGANDRIDTLRAQLEGQSSALQQLGQAFTAAEAQRTKELEESLHR